MSVDEPASSQTIRGAAWPVARDIAYRAARPTGPRLLPLADALGSVLAAPVTTLTDLPSFDTVSMDGWAVAGPGPWLVTGRILAGELPSSIGQGEAAEIATGAPVPPGADAVLRRELGSLTGALLHPLPPDDPLVAPFSPTGQRDIRARGEEATAGEQVLATGTPVTPPVLGLAAAAGHDQLLVHPPPVIDVLIMGDELLTQGPSGPGRLRDSIGPQVAGWLRSSGARLGSSRYIVDRQQDVVAALGTSEADVVITTGGTARGPVDQLHPALAELGARILIDRVAMRPGHPVVLARLRDGRLVLGLPGNPLAAAVSFLSMGWPLIEAQRTLPMSHLRRRRLAGTITAPATAHRLMPVRTDGDEVTPLPHHGPAMLSGLAAADALAVAPPGGSSHGDPIDVLTLPW